MKYWIGVLALVSAVGLKGQVITGSIYDELSKESLQGATVQVLDSDLGTTSVERGKFRLSDLVPGRYAVQVSFVGYQPTVLNDVWVKTGRETVLEIGLVREYTDLEEVTITDQVSFSSPGRLLITEEQINRFAATYYDPARLITSSPDIAISNDQNNLISVRGISPDYNIWSLEGAEIVNPNHLSNAGTFLDQPTATGGGVNILSAQMLSHSAFHYSTFDNTYGNSVGGIFDMRIKSGNAEDRQYTAQASLIGIDLSAEGPYKLGGEATFAANYRYSFTGILTNMGVDFGGEYIGFQDLALSTSVPVGKKSKLKLFGVGGLSFNHFDHRDFEDSEREKDRSDIYYDNKMGAAGASLITSFKDSEWTNTLVASGYHNERDQTFYDNQDAYQRRTNYQDRYTIYSATSAFVKRLSRAELTLGSMMNYYQYHNEENTYFTSPIPNGNRLEKRQLLGRHYLQVSHRISPLIIFNYGLTYNWNNNESQSWDPRGKLMFLVGPNATLALGAGKYSQLYQPFSVYFAGPDTDQVTIGNEADFITSYRYTLSYELTVKDLNLGAELFHYAYPEVLLFFETASARTTGVSITSEKAFSNGFYTRAGGSLFNAPVESESDIENRYNTKFNLSLAGGKEWEKTAEKKTSSFGLNGRFLYQGGQHHQIQNWWFSDRYQTDNYLRFDLRIQWVRYRKKYTRVLAIDLQNALNTQNEAYRYFDNFTGEEEVQHQLGLIPILTYRVEW